MADRIIPCGSEEMKRIQDQLREADLCLLAALARATGDTELFGEIKGVRKILDDLIRRLN